MRSHAIRANECKNLSMLGGRIADRPPHVNVVCFCETSTVKRWGNVLPFCVHLECVNLIAFYLFVLRIASLCWVSFDRYETYSISIHEVYNEYLCEGLYENHSH